MGEGRREGGRDDSVERKHSLGAHLDIGVLGAELDPYDVGWRGGARSAPGTLPDSGAAIAFVHVKACFSLSSGFGLN